jgi:hypothetical protein
MMIGRPDIFATRLGAFARSSAFARGRMPRPGWRPQPRPRPIWRPRPLWTPARPDLLALAGVQVGPGGVKVKSGGVVESAADRTCCCDSGCTSGKICATEYRTQLDCGASSFSTPTANGNKCLPTSTTFNTWTQVIRDPFLVDPCLYRMYVPVSPQQCCTADGDCTTTAPAPPTPSADLSLRNCCGPAATARTGSRARRRSTWPTS